MELTHLTIVVLASMIFVLSGMVGYLYWQQTRILQHIQSLALAVATHLPQQEYTETEPELKEQPEPEAEAEPEAEQEVVVPESEEDDDRVSVEHVTETSSPEEETAKEVDVNDVDDLEHKTKAELQKLLADKGIPYGKSDKKSILIQLLKASS